MSEIWQALVLSHTPVSGVNRGLCSQWTEKIDFRFVTSSISLWPEFVSFSSDSILSGIPPHPYFLHHFSYSHYLPHQIDCRLYIPTPFELNTCKQVYGVYTSKVLINYWKMSNYHLKTRKFPSTFTPINNRSEF